MFAKLKTAEKRNVPTSIQKNANLRMNIGIPAVYIIISRKLFTPKSKKIYQKKIYFLKTEIHNLNNENYVKVNILAKNYLNKFEDFKRVYTTLHNSIKESKEKLSSNNSKEDIIFLPTPTYNQKAKARQN